MTSAPLTGYVCFPKANFHDEFWHCEPFSRGQAWLDLWSLANDRRRLVKMRGADVQLERGQVAWALPSLAERWRWSKDKVRSFLAELQDCRKAIVHGSNITTIITLIDYTVYNPDTAPELPLEPTPETTAEPTAKPMAEPTPETTAEPTQKSGSREEGSREVGKGEGRPPENWLVPSNDEVAAFCRSWAGDLSRGIPGGIPDAWWTGWLADRLTSDRPFPKNWSRVLELKFVSDWVNGHPKARGALSLEKNIPAAVQTSGRPPGWRDGDQEWWWADPISKLESALAGALLGGAQGRAARLREIYDQRRK